MPAMSARALRISRTTFIGGSLLRCAARTRTSLAGWNYSNVVCYIAAGRNMKTPPDFAPGGVKMVVAGFGCRLNQQKENRR